MYSASSFRYFRSAGPIPIGTTKTDPEAPGVLAYLGIQAASRSRPRVLQPHHSDTDHMRKNRWNTHTLYRYVTSDLVLVHVLQEWRMGCTTERKQPPHTRALTMSEHRGASSAPYHSPQTASDSVSGQALPRKRGEMGDTPAGRSCKKPISGGWLMYGSAMLSVSFLLVQMAMRWNKVSTRK